MSSGFWINFNPAANNVLSNLSTVSQQVQQESQIMSTGNAVNSAADNPAAYAISQNMQMESNGLNVAVQNAQQGVAMLQTAAGAQQQVLGILQTMSQLATQAAQSGTQAVSDRAGLQLEMNSLAQEVNSITNQTQYNGLNILSGQFSTATGGSTVTLQVGANAGQTIQFNIAGTDVNSLGVAGIAAGSTSAYTAGTATETGVTLAATGNLITVQSLSGSILETGNYRVVFNGSYSTSSTGTASSTITGDLNGTLQLQIQDGTSWSNVGGAVTVTSGSTGTITLGDAAAGASMQVTFNTTDYGTGTIATDSSGNAITGSASQTDSLTLTGTATSSGAETNNWTSSTNVVGLNILTQSGASSAISAIQNAIGTLTAQEEQLGAVQNRLNYTISDLTNTSSNLQTANSVIVGANMAQEQTQFAQSQILEQAGISVLSQVQQQPGMILKLLQ